ncbi:N-acetylglucosamine-6-phosphate deacetylase [Paenibacillus sp. GCM10027626]|uniref:N-acetylglucosamine-6-phosphate deacetylase n=1 Tax=Paenibacillus sp. GCM10027626 TaxID=3273411 RepID=UPI00363C3C2B
MIQAIHYATGKPVAVTIADGKIAGIEPIEPAAGGAGGRLPYIGPGLVDLQINGYAGYDFNLLPIPDTLVGVVIRKLWGEGVTSSYPTVITNSPAAIAEAMRAIAGACDADPIVESGVAGIHLEGPFISPEDGVRGAHSRDFVMAPDWELFCQWQEAAGGRIKIVTLSPEWPDSAAFIRQCTEQGVLVSIGHTAASPEQIQEAVAAGAAMSTHLGNGAHLMLPRHPNYIWEQLAQDRLWSCLIADSFHLPEQVLKVVMKVKGEQALLVSDAVALSGLAPGKYTTHIGGEVVLTPEGKLHTAANEKILAGSAQMLFAGIEHLMSSGLADLAAAWDMSSIRPAKLTGMPEAAGLIAGAPADFVLFHLSEDGKIQLEETYKAGKSVYSDKGDAR